MSYLQALILGAVQGIAEFLPISSSGHLVVLEKFFRLDVANLMGFDVILHLGTLLAVLIYFWREWLDVLKQIFGQKAKEKFLWPLIVASIPAAIFGGLFGDLVESKSRVVAVVALMLILTALLLFVSSRWPADKKKEKVGIWQSLVIGIGQALAILPGLSRSGTTISFAQFLGIKRENAVRFSFLMMGPAVAGAVIFSLYKGVYLPSLNICLVGLLAALIFSLLAVVFLMRFIKKYSFDIFAVYLLIISVLLIVLLK